MIANIVAYGLSYTQRVNRDGNAMAYGQSKLNALFRAINTCTSVTEALADVIIIDQGEVVDFDTLAEAVYEKNDFLRSIQLAPDGVITYVYPEQGNEAGKINLFTDPDRKAAFDSIDKLGYSYRLTATVNNEEVFVSGLKEKTGGVKVAQTIYGKRWHLTLFPKVSLTDRLFFWGFSGMMSMIALLVSALVSRNRDLIVLNDTDALTGLKNRRGFDKDIANMAADHRLKSACIVAMDINNFKSFNDLYGHSVGDVLLTSFASELHELTGHSGILSRNGGDEFQMLFKNPADDWPEKFRSFFNRKHYFEVDGKEYFYYASAGVALYPEDSRDFRELYRKADAALYHAKSKVHHHISRFRAEMDDEPRVQMGFNFKDLAGGAPGAVLIYKADEGEEILYANSHCLRLFGCDSMQEFIQFTDRSFRNLVHPMRTW